MNVSLATSLVLHLSPLPPPPLPLQPNTKHKQQQQQQHNTRLQHNHRPPSKTSKANGLQHRPQHSTSHRDYLQHLPMNLLIFTPITTEHDMLQCRNLRFEAVTTSSSTTTQSLPPVAHISRIVEYGIMGYILR